VDIMHKDATITPTGSDEDFPGTFEVVLSAPTKDRDGETLLPDEWKQPLPDHITFDADHGMTVATTVGSGVPSLDEETGNLVVSGTYSSLPRAQDVRTLVNEGHIRTTSVAFMSEKTEKDGTKATVREAAQRRLRGDPVQPRGAGPRVEVRQGRGAQLPDGPHRHPGDPRLGYVARG
jgi:hypothetical protein